MPPCTTAAAGMKFVLAFSLSPPQQCHNSHSGSIQYQCNSESNVGASPDVLDLFLDCNDEWEEDDEYEVHT